MSFMLTLFEQADFIKEIQSLLGERLLSVGYDDTELEKEVSTCYDALKTDHILTLLTDSSCRALQNSIWRRSFAVMRGYATRYTRL